MQTVLVTGSTGFIGRHVVEELAGRGHWVRALIRDLKGAETLEGIDCELARGDVTSPESLAAAAEGCDAIVHLVAIIIGKPETFEAVIAEGTRNVVAAAQASGVRKLVHMSALGVGPETNASVPYYRAKWAAEQTVAASGVPHAIVRPSFVFGEGGALPTFVRVARLAPVTPVIGDGRQRIQPIWVGDVARALALALDADGLFELGGPDVVDWNELWRLIKDGLDTRRPQLHVPFWLMRSSAVVIERLPRPPVTRDQLRMLQLGDNVVSDGGASMQRLGLGDCVPLVEQIRRVVAGEPDDHSDSPD